MSKSVVHDFVSNPDTVIVLRNPCVRFAEWKPSTAMSEKSEKREGRSDRNHLAAIKANFEEPEDSPKPTTVSADAEIRFRVCSGNPMSASPWFNRVLRKDGWMQSSRNPEDGLFHISAEDWDEEAFIIIMDIFHLRFRRVPRTITLEMLAKIAILAG